MSKWTRTHTLVAGAILILATNAVALLGIVYNRGDAESALTLTQRELYLPYNWGFEKENSGIVLTLQWRALAEEPEVNDGLPTNYTGFGSKPDWLNKDMLAALGFDVSTPEDTPQGRMYYDKMLSKDVLLVLEFDGPAYRAALERAQRRMQNEAALLTANSGKKEFEERVKNAKRSLYQEERINSRLFVVDAGLDAASLRARHPDRNRYAIVHGQIQPRLVEIKRKPKLIGFISDLSITQINVPSHYRRIFEPLQESARTNQHDAAVTPYKVSVAFGKRLEPWITEATGSK
ncbi:MAG TPA: DUF4824 family protein [Sulfuricaulis sp.]|nr:DUF4824 family protein [Sulfuricaulis sp.]